MFGKKKHKDGQGLSKEEKIINRMRKQRDKFRIMGLIFAILISVASFIIIRTIMVKTDEVMSVNSVIDRFLPYADPENVALFNFFYVMTMIQTKALVSSILFASFIGIFLGCLIIAIIGNPLNPIIASMWDRIKQLEQRLEELSQQQGQSDNIDTKET